MAKPNTKPLFKITHWGNRDHTEVRVELAGNGHYLLVDELPQFLRDNAGRIAAEVAHNLPEEV